MTHKTAYFLAMLFGFLLTAAGIIAAFFGPMELYSYYLFVEGGRFHYEGFNFGSFMFGNIAMQIIGYYIIALLLIPLGYGHLQKISWVPKISLTLIYTWLIFGIPIMLILLFIIVSTKVPSLAVIILCAILLFLSYAVVPFLLIRFYKSDTIKGVFEQNKKSSNFISLHPVPLLITALLYFFYIYAFHLLLFFKGLFPLFGKWLIGFDGFIVITFSLLFFVALILGTLKIKLWIWWASVIYFGSLTISTILTLLSSDFSEMVALLNFPERETNALINIPLQGFHLAIIFGIPLFLSLSIILFSKKYYYEGQRGIANSK